MRTNKTSKLGFTLVEIMIVVAIIGLLAAIAIPNFVKARTTAQKNTCINNLRQIDGAKQQWAMEAHQSGGALPVISDIAPYLGRAGTVAAVDAGIVCPAGGTTYTTFSACYTINNVTNPPTCNVDPVNHVLQ